MAGRWSSENCEIIFYKDIQASTLAVDCVGTWALLAGRKTLAFVDLRDTEKVPVKVTRQSKWDIGCVQWNRHAYHAHRFVTACNQRLDVFDFRESSAAHLSSLKAHSRTVSDVDWSPFDINIVASCSVDTFTYLWDVRDPKKPVKFFQTVSGAYQVKWNKVYNNLFATTHDGDVRIWDPRKENQPLEYISAHPSKIHGLDWSHTEQNKLVTASQDCTIRFWDYQNPRRSAVMINTWNPVWRARYTPFGNGIMSVVVPQIRRGENSVYLWNQDNQQSHVHMFVGHQDVVLEFQWRKQAEGSVDHQLVTWSKDQSLRIWKVDPALQKLCGHEQEEYPFHTIDDLTPTLRRSDSNTSSGQRSRLLTDTENKSPTNAPDDRTSVSTQSSVTVTGGPQGSSMVSGLSQSSSSSFTNGFDHDSLPGSISNGTIQGDKKDDRQSMLEKKYKVEKVKPASNLLSSHPSTSSNHLVPVYPDGKYEDNSVPFPRTCGATFSSNDHLVIFCVPQSLKKMDQESSVTPRSLSDLVRVTAPNQWMRPQHPSMFASLFGSPPPPSPSEGVSISDFFTEKHQHHHYHRKYSTHKSSHHSHGHSHGHGRSRDGLDGKKDRDRETADRAKRRLHKVAKIEVYNVTAISPVNLYLAKNYKVDLVDFKDCCEHNAKVASKINRMDLVQMWNVVSLVLESHRRSSCDDNQQPVALKPFGRPLVEKYLKHFEKYRDVQTMAMIVCMFWDRETRPRDMMMMMRNNHHAAVFSSTTTPSSTVTSTHGFPRPDSRLSFEGVNVETTALGTSNDSGWEMSYRTVYADNVSHPAHTTPQPPPPPPNPSVPQQRRRTLAFAATPNALVSPSINNLNPYNHHRYNYPYSQQFQQQQHQPKLPHPNHYQLRKGLTATNAVFALAACSSTAAPRYSNTAPSSSLSPSTTNVTTATVMSPSPFYSPQPVIPTASVPPTFPSPSPLPPPPPPPPLPPPLQPQPFRGVATKFKGRALAEVASESNLSALFKAVMNKSKRSRSLSESFDDLNAMDKELGEASDDRELTDGRDADLEKINNTKILNPDRRAQYEQIKRAYANILYKWGLLNQRTQVLKHTVSLQSSRKIEFSIPCSNCSDTVMNVQCHRCRYPSLNCAICHVGVRGPANVCLSCGHGGHSSHMMDWFHTYSQCPSGCGCSCLQEAPL